MSALRTAAQQALEFVTSEAWGTTPYMDVRVYEDAARLRDALQAALRAAPAEPVEPVAWLTPGQDLHLNNGEGFRFSDWTPLYLSPPQRQPLTDEEIDRICASLGFAAISPAEIVRAVERAHGIGETK